MRSTILLLSTCLILSCSSDRERDDPGNKNCGNSVIDNGETCDPCPANCDDGVACTADSASGSAGSCTLSCSHVVTTTCAAGDGCCPAGCTTANDTDCSASCGNNTVEALETCDGDCPTSCNDNNACTTDQLTGDASTCSASCLYQSISACAAGDDCCPAGCNNNNDGDCSSTCGNNQVETGETCDGDCPGSCTDSDACTNDIMTGSSANCNVACSRQAITQCRNGDGCCPRGCTNVNDDDCPVTCGNGQPDSGETCDGDCPTSCLEQRCQSWTLSGTPANCDVRCNYAPITACAGGDGCCPSGCTLNNDSDCVVAVGDQCSSPNDCDPLTQCAQWIADCPADGGYCSESCGSSLPACPSGSNCVWGQCLKACSVPGDCRSGYTCSDVDNDAKSECVPATC